MYTIKEYFKSISLEKFLIALTFFLLFLTSFLSNYKIETIIVKSVLSFLSLLMILFHKKRDKFKNILNKNDRLLYIFILYLIISLFWSNNPEFGILKIFQIILLIIPFGLLFKLNLITEIKKELFVILILFSIFTLFFSLFITFNPPVSFSEFGIEKRNISQVILGRFLIISIFFISIINIKQFKVSLILASIIFIYSIALGIISFRAGILAIITIYLIKLYLDHDRFTKINNIILMISFIAGLLSSYYLNENLSNRLKWIDEFSNKITTKDGTIDSRLKAYSFSLSMFFEKPILGYGLGSFNSIYRNDILGKNLKYPHNLFLELLSETGLIGTILFLILLTLSIKNLLNINSLIYLYFFILLFILSLFSKDLSTNVILIIPIFQNLPYKSLTIQ